MRLEVRGGAVASARVSAPMFRGFETVVLGRAPLDALAVMPRVCGICSVSQSVAAARALAAWSGPARMPPNGAAALRLIHAAENLADHLTHFYLFFMPDLADPAYAARPWHGATAQRFRAQTGAAGREATAARSRLLRIVGILAGKWPHSMAIQPGGLVKRADAGEIGRLRGAVAEVRRFLETTLFAAPLEEVSGLTSRDALTAWGAAGKGGDARAFLTVAADLGFDRLGRLPARLMSAGAYGLGDGAALFSGGVWHAGAVGWLDAAAIREDLSHAWLAGEAAAPFDGTTEPLLDKPDAYTWCKAPRLDGAPVEVGALARQVIDGHPLARVLVADGHTDVFSRVAGRLLEVARLVPAMEDWIAALDPGDPFLAEPLRLPDEGRGMALVEAARGTLGHWLTVKGGRLTGYQIVAPTTWNFSPRDENGVAGPLEQALEGAPVAEGETVPVAVKPRGAVVRSLHGLHGALTATDRLETNFPPCEKSVSRV